jgi:tetratricopeptide (TPR) repeat protein
MTKRKKRRRSQSVPKRPSPKLVREVAAAMASFEDGDADTARQQLLALITKYPRSQPVLLALLEVCQQTDDWHTFAFYGQQLLPLERGEDQADTLNNLVYAYIELAYPALAWQYAKELIRQHPDFAYLDQAKSFVETAEPILLQEVEEWLDMAAFSQDEKLELIAQHEQVRFLTVSGHAEEAIEAAEAFLEKVPDMIPVLNNLSLSQFMVGDAEQAIVTARKVLDQDADNFHALGNLVHYYFLTAQFDQTQLCATQLQQISSDNPDLEVKQAEAFAFLGNDEQVWAAYERAKTKQGEKNPLLLHLAATASYRLGDEKTAWRLWRQATKLSPSFDMAQACLAQKRLPVGERDLPWYWPFDYWFSQDFRQLLAKHFGKYPKRMNDKNVERAMNALLADRPYLSQLFPYMLERGDGYTREFVLNFIHIAKSPELLQMLYDFALSQYGADDIRMEAMQFISQNYPAMLPENKVVPMWVKGQQMELLMLGFEISDEPDWIEGVSEETLDKYEVTYDLLMDDELEEAEVLLHEIMAESPDFYSAYNQLAVIYERRGQKAEARKLVEETHARFPDYLFARVALARLVAQEGRVEEARKLMEPLLRLRKLHISEFRTLVQGEMEIDLADKKPEAARFWLGMWRQMEDRPEHVYWERRIDGPGQLLKGLRTLLGRS